MILRSSRERYLKPRSRIGRDWRKKIIEEYVSKMIAEELPLEVSQMSCRKPEAVHFRASTTRASHQFPKSIAERYLVTWMHWRMSGGKVERTEYADPIDKWHTLRI